MNLRVMRRGGCSTQGFPGSQGDGDLGRPSTRSPRRSRWTRSTPPASDTPGAARAIAGRLGGSFVVVGRRTVVVVQGGASTEGRDRDSGAAAGDLAGPQLGDVRGALEWAAHGLQSTGPVRRPPGDRHGGVHTGEVLADDCRCGPSRDDATCHDVGRSGRRAGPPRPVRHLAGGAVEVAAPGTGDGRRRATRHRCAPLRAEGDVDDGPPVPHAADDVLPGHPRCGEHDVVGQRSARHLAQRAHLDAVVLGACRGRST